MPPIVPMLRRIGVEIDATASWSPRRFFRSRASRSSDRSVSSGPMRNVPLRSVCPRSPLTSRNPTTVFGSTWRIVLASLVAFWAGEFCNSYVLARMKVKTSGKWLWARTIGSTIVGEGVDSLTFYNVAFYGAWPASQLLTVMLSNYMIKVSWETAATPLTYRIVNALKRAESEDFYDRHTDFNPFRLGTETTP